MSSKALETNIKKSMNRTGVFLERKVFEFLRNHRDFNAVREAPYALGNSKQDHEGTVDIHAAAAIPGHDLILMLAIECKRADPDQKHWIFDRRLMDPKEPDYSFYFYNHAEEHPLVTPQFFFDGLGYQNQSQLDRAIQGFECREVDGLLNLNRSERVFNSLRQANEAFAALAPDTFRTYKLAGFGRPVDIVSIPVVVTTANLWLMDYEPGNVSWDTGTIDSSNLNLMSKNWLHYEYPLPSMYQIPALYGSEKLLERKRPTFIVAAPMFENFVKALMQDVTYFVD